MNFEVNKIENISVVTCNIEKLDTQVAPELKSQFVFLDTEGEVNYILDMSEVKYCDSSGLSALLVGNRFAKSSKGSFVICGLQPNVEKLINISQLHSVLNIVKNKEAAYEYFNQ
jgi:anti-anti-sigma factor